MQWRCLAMHRWPVALHGAAAVVSQPLDCKCGRKIHCCIGPRMPSPLCPACHVITLCGAAGTVQGVRGAKPEQTWHPQQSRPRQAWGGSEPQRHQAAPQQLSSGRACPQGWALRKWLLACQMSSQQMRYRIPAQYCLAALTIEEHPGQLTASKLAC